VGAVEDILEWSTSKLTPWRQDALRRLATGAAIGAQDHDDLLSLIKECAGFSISPKPAAPIALAKAHLSAVAAGASLQIKAIRNVTNVNRLMQSAALTFAIKGLTVIYGRNGSGKSGFVRIFRTACRTRSDNPAKLKVLADVYGSSAGPQEAEIVIETASGEVIVPWKAGWPASEALLQVAVFDSSAAELYVDGGNQIQFLPFGLALPHELNALCITLKSKLDAERKPTTDQIVLVMVAFELQRATKVQTFYSGLSAKTTDAQIDEIAKFSKEDQIRVDELIRLLTATTASAADLTALSTWVQGLGKECDSLAQALSDAKLHEYHTLKQQAVEARKAAGLDAKALFSTEPLPGVGGETWRRLWLAARDYSIADAYPAREFPVLNSGDVEESCLLCHQPLTPAASERLERFQAFVGGALATVADRTEARVAAAIIALPKLATFTSKDWPTRLEQIRKRGGELAEAISVFQSNVAARHAAAVTTLQGTEAIVPALSPLISPEAALTVLSQLLSQEATALASADEAGQRAILAAEQAELADRKIFAAARETVIKRRDLLKLDALYLLALAEVQTTGITKKANDLVDVHLTKVVIDRYEAERKALDITHLKVGLTRKSDQTKAAFQTTPGTTLTKLTSDILSEGEQRALALAAFLTEVAVTEGNGPIIVDDPVSSLDRDRGLKVAERIASEAQTRQVVVFTHDLVFFNDLCREADSLGVTAETLALFADATNAGKVDSAGVVWRGLNVNKRLARIRNDFAPVKKSHAASPADYEIAIKNLYGRLRDTYERLVEEYIFCDVIRRGVDRIETQKLRMVHLSDALAVRFHDGMSKANTYSHDNPAAATVAVPDPTEFESDLASIEKLIGDLKIESSKAEAARPSMKLK
jgi:energy-coupling factor transporter ATP-binding protein EcfA2